MGEFRDRMDRDLRIRGYAEGTRQAYLRCVRTFVGHFMRRPDELSLEHIHTFQLHLTAERNLSWSAFNVYVCALRFFFHVTLGKDWNIEQIPYQKRARPLPLVLSPEEALAVVEAPTNLKHRAILQALYGAGLRAREVTHLRPDHIDSRRGLVWVVAGKGRKDRYAPLSERFLETARAYWREQRPPAPWLFPGPDAARPLTRSSVGRIVRSACRSVGITKAVTPHTLRHSFATHLMNHGANLREIQKILGHRSLRTTEIYTHLAPDYLARLESPLDTPPS